MNQEVMIPDAFHLARFFTEERHLSFMEGKFFQDGMKTIEVFMNDIHTNLNAWSVDKVGIVYRTTEYMYSFILDKKNNIIRITRFTNGSWTRIDVWMNVHSCSVGKDWLMQEPQKSKRIPMFS
jgi:hypothetical protein